MKTKLKVTGMHCKSCEVLIKDSLEELPGIQSVNVDHKKGFVEVLFDQSKVSIDLIKKVIVKEGYKID